MKFNIKASCAGLLAVVILLPGFAFAETSVSVTAEMKNGVNFCIKLPALQTKLSDQIIAVEKKQSESQADRAIKLAKKEGDIDAKKAQGRADIDGKRMKNWDKMTTKAKTIEQKAAVASYKASIQTAVTVRRAAVDASVKAYRDGLAQVLGNHTNTRDQGMVEFKASVAQAITKAQADCTASVASKTVHKNFEDAISAARKTLQTTRGTANTTPTLEALKKTRNDAIKSAEQAFKESTEKAHADLVIALKK